MANTREPVSFCRKGIAKSRNVNSSLVAARTPMATPAIHGNGVFTMSE